LSTAKFKEMKTSLYLEKDDFEEFLVWVNRLGQGVLSTCPVKYYYQHEKLKQPIQLLLESDEYAMMRDTERDLEELQKKAGNIDLIFKPMPTESDKILVQGILQNANRWDIAADIVVAAIEIGQELTDITPLEALIIAEREIMDAENEEDNFDI